jgi:hypothetical protein
MKLMIFIALCEFHLQIYTLKVQNPNRWTFRLVKWSSSWGPLGWLSMSRLWLRQMSNFCFVAQKINNKIFGWVWKLTSQSANNDKSSNELENSSQRNSNEFKSLQNKTQHKSTFLHPKTRFPNPLCLTVNAACFKFFNFSWKFMK